MSTFTVINEATLVQAISGCMQRLVYIAPGSLEMGSPPTEKGRNPDEERHTVTLTRGFYLAQTEVTRAQWQQLMDSSPAGNDGCGPRGTAWCSSAG